MYFILALFSVNVFDSTVISGIPWTDDNMFLLPGLCSSVKVTLPWAVFLFALVLGTYCQVGHLIQGLVD